MDFPGFSPESFEQLVRALAVSVIGPGVTAFGNGPDGGREATFQGRIPYPYPPTTVWDGYGVIQAKFKEKDEGVDKNCRWVESQLRAELNKWLGSGGRHPKPQYFIFCTNVDLSSASGGGRDRASAIIQSYASTLGLKDHAVWDANQLRTYVDGNEGVRRRFLCLLTGGDLLAEFATTLQRAPDPDALLTAYLVRELLAEEDARLSQAGDRSEDRISLAQVFIDLPTSEKWLLDPSLQEHSERSLHRLLRAASQRLDPLALYERDQGVDEADKSKQIFGRFVFIGGPGSGKSTIGQFLAQIHRAALLARRPVHRLEDRVKKIIGDIKLRCEEENAPWPGTPRYPFRVELNEFAKALSSEKDGVSTLSEYLRKKLSRDIGVLHEDLRAFLRSFPSLLILDGLDEVPPSSNRRDVVAAIRSFMAEARDMEADLMMVATSRPDGYEGEFDGEHVLQLYLAPLSKAQALDCARRYLTAKAVVESRLANAMSILDSAADNPLIGRLMRSPLQVTFMVTVVVASGKPSESRWQLFNDYYRTIYERELHKAAPPFDQVLSARRQDIDALHHRVGFLLQYRAEQSGGTQADLSIAEFEQIVEACLNENGLPPEDLASQKRMILGAASSRLVFLTSRRPGRLSFDVRSLQEYMAAACLTNADSTEVMNRLDAIVHSGYWRNTLLFAVGRFFVEPQMRSHRDKIRILCEDLNRKDPDRAKVLMGSRLALEILESGIVGKVPLVTRSLARCALELLSLPHHLADNATEKLAGIYEPGMEAEFTSEISLRIGQRNIAAGLSAWLLVLNLEHKAVAWATETVELHWPREMNEAVQVLRAWFEFRRAWHSEELLDPSPRELERLIQFVSSISLNDALNVLNHEAYKEGLGGHWLQALARLFDHDDDRPLELRVGAATTGMSIRMCFLPREEWPSTGALEHLATEHEQDTERAAIAGLVRFLRKPGFEGLVSMLDFLDRSETPRHWRSLMETKAPWPLACLSAGPSPGKKWAVADLRGSLFDDEDSWYSREQAWVGHGITLDELCEPLFPGGPSLCAGVRTMAMEFVGAEDAERTARAMFDKLALMSHAKSRDDLAWMLEFYLSETSVLHRFDPALVRDWLLPAREVWWSSDLVVDFSLVGDNQQAWLSLYNFYGLQPSLRFDSSPWNLEHAAVDLFLNVFCADPSQRGLLRLVGFWCAVGKRSTRRDLPTFWQFSDPKDRLALLVVRMADTSLTLSDAEELARYVENIAQYGVQDTWDMMLCAVEAHGKDNPALQIILNKILDLLPVDDSSLRGWAGRLKNRLLQLGSSKFGADTLVSLGMPAV